MPTKAPKGRGAKPGVTKQRALEEIRRKIFSLKHQPGSFISAKGLAQELGMSRTPVREAMETLARDGLIEWFGGAGARIRKVEDDDLIEIFTLRRLIEVDAASELGRILNPPMAEVLDGLLREMEAAIPAADRKDAAGIEAYYDLDAKFHRTLGAVAGMSRAEAYIGNLMDHFRLYALQGMSEPQEILGDHAKIVEAINDFKKHPDRVRKAVEKHLENSIRRRAPHLWEKVEARWGAGGKGAATASRKT